MADQKFGLRIGVSVKGQQQINQLGQKVKGVEGKVNSLKTAFVGLNRTIGTLTGLFVTGTVFSKIFGTTAQLESQTRSLTVLTGSAQTAGRIIGELRQFGAQTPFQVSELIETAKRLNAFGVEAEKVVETTKRLADVSGATGAELAGLATAYGQVQAKGRLQGEELLQFQERGVALQQELKEMYNLSGQEFQKALEGARISSEAVEVAIERLTEKGGKYADGAIAQSDTLNGLFSTLKDNVEVLAQTIGNVLAPVIKDIFSRAIEALKAVNQLLAAGRSGGFQRSLVGIRGAMTFGATTEGVDRAQALLGQITPQRNRPGLEANRAALRELSAVLTGVGPNDPNADRAVRLQGQILQMLQRNSAAMLSLPAAASMSDRVDVPSLLQGRSAAGGKKATTKETVQHTAEMRDLLLEINRAKESGNVFELAGLEYNREILRIQEQGITGTNREIELDNAKTALNLRLQGIYGVNVAKLKEAKEETEKTKTIFDGIKDTVARGLGNAIESLIDGTKTLGESLAGILKQLGSMAIQFGMQSLMGGLFPAKPNAKGNVFASNGIVPFARGGVVGSPTLFPFAKGIGLMGEAGPEAIMPLRRGKGGRLGVEAQGGIGGVVVNVDASGTEAQGDNDRAQQLGNALGAAVRAELIKQKRPGGILS